MRDRTRRIAAGLAFLFLASAAPAPARAATPGTVVAETPVVEAKVGGLAFSLAGSLGAVGGTAYERAYAPGVRDFKISELKWELENLATVGLQGTVGFADAFGVSLSYRTVVNEGDGTMVDRDWLYLDTVTDEMWTHRSEHPDTSVDDGTMLDVGLSAGARLGGLRLSGILGYRRDDWKWTARGGSFVYSDLDSGGFRDVAGFFPAGQSVIEYEQEYTYPYLGLGLEGGKGAFGFSAKVLYSPWVSATDSDYHVLRDLRFEGDFSDGKYLGVGLTATWSFTRRFFAAFAFDYQSISEITGDVTVTGPETGWATVVLGGAGSVEIATTAYSALAGFRF